ncbi:IQ-domain [Sarracenia purpurea var. burkii]
MDLGESKGSTKGRNSYSNHEQTDRTEHHRFSTHSAPHHRPHSKQDHHREISPAPSVLNDASPRACSSHFEDYSFGTAHSSPQHYPSSSSAVSKTNPFAFPTRPEYAADSLSYDCHFFPNYMANTESSRAKARSHSAPKARPEGAFESQLSRRRASLEGRNVPRAVRMMQRSSSQVGAAAAQIYQYPGLIKLDRSSVSLQESECGSTSTVLTNTIYCRSLVGFDVNGNRY